LATILWLFKPHIEFYDLKNCKFKKPQRTNTVKYAGLFGMLSRNPQCIVLKNFYTTLTVRLWNEKTIILPLCIKNNLVAVWSLIIPYKEAVLSY